MSKTEIIKCCSPDGRIQIPKYMRDALNIQDSEPLILKVDGQCLTMEKYQEMETLESLCRFYLQAFAKNCGCPVAICNTEHVLISRGIPLSSTPLLSKKLRESIQNNTSYTFDAKEPLDLFGDTKYRIDTLFPISGFKGPVGAVLLLHYRNVQSSERICAKFLADIISEHIINQNIIKAVNQ